MDGTIAQTYISAVHSFETRILRFRIEHLRASRVVGTWLLARWLPSDIAICARKYADCGLIGRPTRHLTPAGARERVRKNPVHEPFEPFLKST